MAYICKLIQNAPFAIKISEKNPNAKLSTSSPISEKPISSTFVWLIKHGHGQLGNHIIMVPLRILRGERYFFEILMALYIFLRKINLSLLFLRTIN